MQCTLAEKLIPLFVSDDLPDDQMRTLREHLNGCATCRQLAAEFSESQDWLRTFAAPAFDEAIFDELHAGLARDIAGNEQRQRWFAPRWNPRFAFAAAMAVILLIAAFGIYVIRHQPRPNDKLTLHPENVDRNDDQPPKTDHRDQAMNSKRVAQHGERERPEPRQVARSLKHKPFSSRAPRSRQSAVIATITPPPPIVDVATNNATSQQEMLRIEMQTADPNVRIIWLAPKSSDSNALNTNK